MNCPEINDIFDSNAPDELLVGAALAATMALQVNDGAPERTRHPEDSAPVTTATSFAEHEPLQIDANRVENAMDSNGPSDSTSLPVAAPLDPNTIVVLSVPNRYLNARRAASLELFYKELLRHLQSVPGLNVIGPEHVAPFLASGTLEKEIARELAMLRKLCVKIQGQTSLQQLVGTLFVGRLRPFATIRIFRIDDSARHPDLAERGPFDLTASSQSNSKD